MSCGKLELFNLDHFSLDELVEGGRGGAARSLSGEAFAKVCGDSQH